MGRLADRRARALTTIAFLVLFPLASMLSTRFAVADGSAALWLPSGLIVAYLLSVGPAGGVGIVAAMQLDAFLQGRGAPSVASLTVAVAVALVWVIVVRLLEARFAHHGPVRSPAVIVDFVLLAGLAGPVLSVLVTVGTTQLLGTAAPAGGYWSAVTASGLGVLAVAAGARMLLLRERIVLDRRAARDTALATIATTLMALLTVRWGGIDVIVDSYFVLTPMLVLALLAGTVAYAVGVFSVSAALMGVLGVAGGTQVLDMPLGNHASWWAAAAAALLLAAEGDRRSALMREYETLFDESATAAAEVTLTTALVGRGNRALSSLTGFTAEELEGRPLAELLVESPEEPEPCRQLFEGEVSSIVCHLHVRCKDGGLRWVRFSANRVRTPGPQSDVIIAQFVDLTMERQREDALRRSNDALEQFGRRVSHDLKQPLAAIAGYAGTLMQHSDKLDPELTATMHERLDAAARRAIEQLDEVFAGAGVDGGVRTHVRLPELVASVVELLEIDLTEARGEVVTAFGSTVIEADAVLLRQVLLNLVTNSLKYARPGVPPVVRLTTRPRGGGVEFTVTDNGRGIPPDELERVFEPGHRLAPDAALGRGLGLSDSRGLIESVGGWLRAEPWPDGARFVAWMPDPLAADEAHAPIRVLIVDDEADQRSVVRAGLDLEPRLEVVGEAASIADAISATVALRPDVVLLDRWLGDGDGLDAVADLARAHPDVRVVILTADATPDLVARARAGGVLRTVDKAVPTADLVQQLVDARP